MTRYIVDTHIFLWMDSAPNRLSERLRSVVDDDSNVLYLSYAAIWEIQIKVSNGRLKLSLPLKDLISDLKASKLQLLPIQINDIYRTARLPKIHHDPFDRMMIAQALERDMTLITVDEMIRLYDVKTIE